MNKVKKIIKVLAIAISFGFIALSGVEVVSGLLGDVSLFGFNLTEVQQKITHYITSGGLAIVGGLGVVLNDFLNRKLIESRNLTNQALQSAISVGDKYSEIKNEVRELRILVKQLTADNSHLAELITADLSAKLSNPLIDKKAKELIEEAINGKKETII